MIAEQACFMAIGGAFLLLLLLLVWNAGPPGPPTAPT